MLVGLDSAISKVLGGAFCPPSQGARRGGPVDIRNPPVCAKTLKQNPWGGNASSEVRPPLQIEESILKIQIQADVRLPVPSFLEMWRTGGGVFGAPGLYRRTSYHDKEAQRRQKEYHGSLRKRVNTMMGRSGEPQLVWTGHLSMAFLRSSQHAENRYTTLAHILLSSSPSSSSKIGLYSA